VSAASSVKRLGPALAAGIADCMREDPRVLVWGEDVRIGVMGPTRGLVDEFGPERVLDCPISEAGFVGAAVGAAAGGLRPVVDIMFSSFTYVAFDQLANQAGRLRYMTGGQVTIPLVIVGSAGAAGAHAASLRSERAAAALSGCVSRVRCRRTRPSG
jgi:pyruvate dehydrogenase E1 component beta subunit